MELVHEPCDAIVRTALVMCLAFVIAYAPSSRAVTIDSFDSGSSFVLEAIGGNAQLTQAAQVLGGTREINTYGRIAFDPSSGLDLFSSWVELTYRMPETDLTAGGEDRFLITIAATPLQADWLYLSVLITTLGIPGVPPFPGYDGGPIVSSGRAIVGPPSGPIELELFPPFGILVMAHAQEILLSIYGYREDQAEFNVRLVDFSTVPEPETALLGVISALAIVAARRLASMINTFLRTSELFDSLKRAAAEIDAVVAGVAPSVVVVLVLLAALGCTSLRLRESDDAGTTTAKVAGRIALGITTLGISEIHYSDWRQSDEREAALSAEIAAYLGKSQIDLIGFLGPPHERMPLGTDGTLWVYYERAVVVPSQHSAPIFLPGNCAGANGGACAVLGGVSAGLLLADALNGSAVPQPPGAPAPIWKRAILVDSEGTVTGAWGR